MTEPVLDRQGRPMVTLGELTKDHVPCESKCYHTLCQVKRSYITGNKFIKEFLSKEITSTSSSSSQMEPRPK